MPPYYEDHGPPTSFEIFISIVMAITAVAFVGLATLGGASIIYRPPAIINIIAAAIAGAGTIFLAALLVWALLTPAPTTPQPVSETTRQAPREEPKPEPAPDPPAPIIRVSERNLRRLGF